MARNGAHLQTASNMDFAIQSCRQLSADMLIVDLATPLLDVAELVTAVKRETPSSPTIVAFGPHVHEGWLTAARGAGCDYVTSRGQFFNQLDAILDRVFE
jgi:DNA-binding NtrC family response regulator